MKNCNCWKAMGNAAYLWGYINSMKKTRKDLNFLSEKEIDEILKKLQEIIDITGGKGASNGL